jgi:ATP-dependent Clp protease adaptor protein ClpS
MSGRFLFGGPEVPHGQDGGEKTMAGVTDSPQIDESVDTHEQTAQSPDSPWVTIVWNDPVNLQTYVSWVFRSYFGHSPAAAERLMLVVHNEGRAVVATGGREEMERHVEAMHDFGLWATLARSDA